MPAPTNSQKTLVTEYILTCPVILLAHDPDEGPADVLDRKKPLTPRAPLS